LYKIDAVLGDWHSWRQSDTAAVTWYFANQKLDILHPRFFDISSTPSGLDNPHGFRFVEFPVYNLGHLATYKFLQFSHLSRVFNYPFEAAGRLLKIVFWLIGGWFFYHLPNQLANRKTAFAVVFFWLFLPYNIYYSRTILPDPLTVSLSIIGLFYWFRFYNTGQNRQLILAALLTALALLTKPYAVFIIAPVVGLLFIFKLKNKDWLTKGLIIGSLSLLPLLWWRWWMKSFPEGIPYNKWLFNAGGMRLKPAWWRWLFYERIAKLIAGGWLTTFILQAFNLPLSQIKQSDLKALGATLNNWVLRPSGTEGMRIAEVCTGGVNTDELSSKSMEVKSQAGLYFIGETVDVTGWLGGYNFQWAWSSGWAAGQVV